MRRFIAYVTAVTVLSCAGLGAFVFLSGTPRWPTGFITMHLQLGSGEALLDGAPSWGAAIEGALSEWNGFLVDRQFRVVPDSTIAIRDGDLVNNVFFSERIHDREFGEDTVAVTTSWVRGSVRVESDVIFNSAFDWNSYRGPLTRTSGGKTLYDIRRVGGHEFGHVLGLGHPDEAGQNVTGPHELEGLEHRSAAERRHRRHPRTLRTTELTAARRLAGRHQLSAARSESCVPDRPGRSLPRRPQARPDHQLRGRRGQRRVDAGVSAVSREPLRPSGRGEPRDDADRRAGHPAGVRHGDVGEFSAAQRAIRLPQPAGSQVPRRPAAQRQPRPTSMSKATSSGRRSTCATASAAAPTSRLPIASFFRSMAGASSRRARNQPRGFRATGYLGI